MIRAGLLLLLLLATPAVAEPAGRFDTFQATQVLQEALSFMAPRILEPVPIGQLTMWGLRGLTTIDPDVTTSLADGHVKLVHRSRPLLDVAVPTSDKPAAWAELAVRLCYISGTVSPVIQAAGTQGVIVAFFDELFNHLDPYSRYVAPRDAIEDRARRFGRAGLGLTLSRRDNQIVVQSVIAEGPAAGAGMRSGDILMRVDNQTVQGQDTATVDALISGQVDTEVSLVWKSKDSRLRSAALRRAMVPPETVYSARISDMLVLRLTGFSYTTDAHLAQALAEGLDGDHPPSGIVLDLRGNRGGLVRQAVDAADMFLIEGPVVTAAGRDPEANHAWRSVRGQLASGYPVVVIVDGRTASAAEILASAIADRGRGVVVGSATLGKGLVQTVDPLPDGGELFITWSRLLAPRGWPIQGLGLMPQVCTSRGRDALRKQLDALAEGRQPMTAAVTLHRSARAPISDEAVIASRGSCPPAEGRDADMDAARLLIENPAAYAAALLPPLREMR